MAAIATCGFKCFVNGRTSDVIMDIVDVVATRVLRACPYYAEREWVSNCCGGETEPKRSLEGNRGAVVAFIMKEFNGDL